MSEYHPSKVFAGPQPANPLAQATVRRVHEFVPIGLGDARTTWTIRHRGAEIDHRVLFDGTVLRRVRLKHNTLRRQLGQGQFTAIEPLPSGLCREEIDKRAQELLEELYARYDEHRAKKALERPERVPTLPRVQSAELAEEATGHLVYSGMRSREQDDYTIELMRSDGTVARIVGFDLPRALRVANVKIGDEISIRKVVDLATTLDGKGRTRPVYVINKEVTNEQTDLDREPGEGSDPQMFPAG